MSTKERWLLPEGIEEALPEEAARLEYYRRKLLDVFRCWGYELVIPPFIEYLESLLVGTAHDLDLQTFKLTDQLNGRLMGVRSDMTPQVARIDAHLLKREAPARLCYIGTVLRTRADGVGGSRSPLQVGAELYGHAGIDSDIEVIRLMFEVLRLSGIRATYMDVGHVGIYWNLARQAGLDTEQELALFDMLQRKACPEIKAFLKALALPGHLFTMLKGLAELNGADEVLREARALFKQADPKVIEALDYVEQVARRLRRYLPELDLHFDLAELRGYHYKTGIVFAAFVPGQGQEIARGGRYDEIGKVFGRARPATGFSTDLKTLVALAPHRPAPDAGGIFVEAVDEQAAEPRIGELRAAGERVVCGLRGDHAHPKAMGCDRRLVNENNEWIVRALE